MAPAVPRVVPVGYQILNDTFGSKVPSPSKSGFSVETMAACAVRPAHARSVPPAWPAVQGGSNEALFRARRLFAFAPHCDARGRRPIRPGAGQQSGEEDQNRDRLLDNQRQGPGPGPRIRQRGAADRRPRHRAVDRRPEPGLRPGAAGRQARALSRPGVAQLHHLGAAQDVRPDLPADLAKWPNLKAYVDRVAARPKVQEALKAEGLIK